MSLAARKPEKAPHPTQGEVSSATLPTVLHRLGEERATGVLTLTATAADRSVFLQDGLVQFATSTDRDDRFNQVLLKAGVISLRDLLRALEVSLATRDRLGEVLIRSRMVTAADVDKWVKVQVREIICGMFARTSGRWSFEARPFPAESISLGLSPDVLVIEGVRRITSWARTYEEVGGLNAEYLATQRSEEKTRNLPLLPPERLLLDMCRTPTSLGEMCDASEMSDFQVCRSVWSLLLVGALMKA